MSDYSAMMRLAEAATGVKGLIFDMDGPSELCALAAFVAENPSMVLALIAENESLKGSCKALGGRNLRALERANRRLERENTKHIANRDEFVSCMERKGEEIDQLKAEIETLRKDAERYQWLRKTESWNGAEDHPEMIADIWIVESYEKVFNRSGDELDRAVDHFIAKDQQVSQ